MNALVFPGWLYAVVKQAAVLVKTLSLSCCSFLQAAAQGQDGGESYFLLGKLYWDMGEEGRSDRSKAHTHLLKVGTAALLLKGQGSRVSFFFYSIV